MTKKYDDTLHIIPTPKKTLPNEINKIINNLEEDKFVDGNIINSRSIATFLICKIFPEIIGPDINLLNIGTNSIIESISPTTLCQTARILEIYGMEECDNEISKKLAYKYSTSFYILSFLYGNKQSIDYLYDAYKNGRNEDLIIYNETIRFFEYLKASNAYNSDSYLSKCLKAFENNYNYYYKYTDISYEADNIIKITENFQQLVEVENHFKIKKLISENDFNLQNNNINSIIHTISSGSDPQLIIISNNKPYKLIDRHLTLPSQLNELSECDLGIQPNHSKTDGFIWRIDSNNSCPGELKQMPDDFFTSNEFKSFPSTVTSESNKSPKDLVTWLNGDSYESKTTEEIDEDYYQLSLYDSSDKNILITKETLSILQRLFSNANSYELLFPNNNPHDFFNDVYIILGFDNEHYYT
jgi:hypothetical protein